MLDFYHGQLNGNVHWYKDEVHDVSSDAGDKLIERGKAVEVKAKTKVVAKPVAKKAYK